jgi:murein DD-endopeptidase MepM/ murein hydrolase activator NlpD
MSHSDSIIEPPVEPGDTSPSYPVLATVQRQRRYAAFSLLSLLLAAGLTAATAILLLAPAPDEIPINSDQPVMQSTLPDLAPTLTPDGLPTLNAEQRQSLLESPVLVPGDGAGQIVRDVYNPFTTVEQRPRGETIQYTVEPGDSINLIATRFGLKPETIAWSNPRRMIESLQPGDVMNIPPEDGVLVRSVGSTTLADYARQYQITDPFTIIDSDYNPAITTLSPESIPPSGTWLFLPGGIAESINWNPVVEVEQAGPRRGFVTTFAVGDPGSCGQVENSGGGAGWGLPLRSGSYTITQGYSIYHQGIDLAASVGTPVLAANSGVVIFAGTNSSGYGLAVVLAHGPYLTVYGHLSQWNVRCGEQVGLGQIIGLVGNTGRSSGPHLHFEIRRGYEPTNPGATLNF